MTGEEIKLNIDGCQFTLRKGVQDTQNNEGIKKVLTIFDKNRDGQISEEEFEDAKAFTAGIFGFNRDGKSVTYNEDIDGDGKLDYTSTWKYDDEGHIYEQVKQEDQDNDGNMDYAEKRIFDKNRNLLKKEFDYEADGNVDHVLEFGYDYSENLKYERDTYITDGNTTMVEQNNYEENGSISRLVDTDGDGNWNEKEYHDGEKSFTENYDNNGNYLGTLISNHGTAASRFTWKTPDGKQINLNFVSEDNLETLQDEKGNLYRFEGKIVIPLKNDEAE